MTKLNDLKLRQLERQMIDISGNQMTVGEATRWMLLVEAFDFINQECEEKGIEFDIDAFTKKSKPHKAVTRYINERYVAFLHGLFV